MSRRRWNIAALLALLGAAAGQGCGDGTEPGGFGSIRGRVNDIERTQTVEGVTITVAGHSTQADAAGFYRLDSVPAGRQTLTATHPSYHPYTAEVTIPRGGETEQHIALLSGTGISDKVFRVSASPGATEGTVSLEWERVAHALNYNIYWSTSPGVTPATGTKIPEVGSPYVHTGLAAGTTYYYVVTGVGAVGEGPPSPEVQAVARGSIAVLILFPDPEGFLDTVVTPVALISSAFSLVEVTAQIGGVSAPMTVDAVNHDWRVQLSLASLPSPATVLVQITARDVNGNLGSASISARYDRHPTLVVTAPENGAVARPTAAIRTTCTDDTGGCREVTVLEAERRTLLFTGQGDVNSTFSLAQYEGRKVFLEVHTTDEAGQETVVQRYVFVETHQGLTPAASAGSGIVIDADADRLLVNNATMLGDHGPLPGDTARIVIRGNGASTTLFTDPHTMLEDGHLGADGALLLTRDRDGIGNTQVRQFRNGSLTTLTDARFIDDFQVEGDFAAWLQVEISGTEWNLIWRDLAAGTSDVVEASPQGLPSASADLAPNGDLVYVLDGEVFRYRGGVSQPQTDNASAGLAADFARTDGTLIVQAVRPVGGNQPGQLVLLDPGGDVVLAPGGDARLNNGWIAFTRSDIGGAGQIWVRAPGGTETQLTFFGSSSGIVELSGNGEVVFRNEFQNLFRVSPGSAPTEIAGPEARPIFIGGVLHVMVGDVLFRVN